MFRNDRPSVQLPVSFAKYTQQRADPFIDRRASKKPLLSICLSIILIISSGYAKNNLARVLVDSWADETYESSKEANDEAPRLETYHFVKGKRFGGYLLDESIDQVDFLEMVEYLALEMRKRNFHPAASPQKGDFLIIVHWGVTGIQDAFEDLFPGVTFGEFTTGNSEEDQLNEDRFTYREASNAKLIGFDRAIRRKGLSIQSENELREMLREERYFMLLMAYDWQQLRQTGEKVLLWSTRFSLRAVSTNFREAHFALSRGASDYFGTNLDGKLGRARVNLGPGEIIKSELDVIETLEDE